MKPVGKQINKFWLKLPLRHRGLAILAIPISCLITALTVFSLLQLKLVQSGYQVEQAQKIHNETERLITTIVNAETGVHRYLITGQEDYLDSYQVAFTIVPDSFKELQPLIEQNLAQQQRLELAQQLTDESLAMLKELEQKGKVIKNNYPDIFSLTELTAEIDKVRDVIEEAKWYLYLISTMKERRFLASQYDLARQKKIYWSLLGIIVIIGSLGSLLAIYLIFHLDEELQKREKSLCTTNKLLSQVNEQLQLFTANASHELRAPLAAVMSNAQAGLLAPPHDLERPRQKLAKIVALSKSMSELIGNLLFLARQENIFDSCLIEPVDLVLLLQDLSAEFKIKAEEKKILLQSDFPESSVLIKIEPELLCQAISNLLSNAIKYSSAGDKILFKLEVQPTIAIVKVEDSGMGIPADALPLIFKPFYRVDKVRSRQAGGYGLGLAIAQRIVQAHDGEIEVTSVVDRGSTFAIKLPRKVNR